MRSIWIAVLIGGVRNSIEFFLRHGAHRTSCFRGAKIIKYAGSNERRHQGKFPICSKY